MRYGIAFVSTGISRIVADSGSPNPVWFVASPNVGDCDRVSFRDDPNRYGWAIEVRPVNRTSRFTPGATSMLGTLIEIAGENDESDVLANVLGNLSRKGAGERWTRTDIMAAL